MKFGEVIEAMRENPSRKFARMGWNGSRMFIYLVPGHKVLASDWTGPKECIQHKDVMQDDGVTITEHFVLINSHVDMKTADGSVICGWLATQTDMLKEDWIEVF